MNNDDKFDKIETKIDKVLEEITDIKVIQARVDVTLDKQHDQLAEHIKRTNLLEQQLRPIETHVAMVNGALKLLGVVSLLAGLVVSILKIVG